jgi:tetratricopeptide (TPR) repeat protein
MRKSSGTSRSLPPGPGAFAHPRPSLVPPIPFAESRRARAQVLVTRAHESIRLGHPEAALEALEKAVTLAPALVEAQLLLAKLSAERDDLPRAKAACVEAIRHWGAVARPEIAIGVMCCDCPNREDRELAARYLIRALEAYPLSAQEYRSTGYALATIGYDRHAIDAFHRALKIEPDVTALTELGSCHIKLRDPAAAEAAFRAALRMNPASPAAHANLGLLLLVLGDYPQGFREFEWRTQLDNFSLFYHFEGFAAPRWTGESLAGKTILLHAEQGFGDTLQFIRYVPHVAALGATVVLAVQPGLTRLLQGFPGVHACISAGEASPALDFHCPLMSLPVVFGTTRQTVPPLVPIPFPAPDSPAPATSPRPLRVGLVWAGNPNHPTDHVRSLTLAELAPLAIACDIAPDAVEFVSLQHGPAVAQLHQTPLAFPIEDACSRAADFAETAAIVATLDLVLAVDTSVAHLAATLQKPVWLFLGAVPEWRWGLDDESTPWYPNLRVFRATTAEARPATIARMAHALTIAAAGFRQLQLQAPIPTQPPCQP